MYTNKPSLPTETKQNKPLHLAALCNVWTQMNRYLRFILNSRLTRKIIRCDVGINLYILGEAFSVLGRIGSSAGQVIRVACQWHHAKLLFAWGVTAFHIMGFVKNIDFQSLKLVGIWFWQIRSTLPSLILFLFFYE